MDRPKELQKHIQACCDIVLSYIQEQEKVLGAVPATLVNEHLRMNFSATRSTSQKPAGQKGWLLATFARMLEDQKKIEILKKGGRTHFRSSAT